MRYIAFVIFILLMVIVSIGCDESENIANNVSVCPMETKLPNKRDDSKLDAIMKQLREDMQQDCY